MMRALVVLTLLCCGWFAALEGQVRHLSTETYQEHQRTSILRTFVHYGKWLTAAAAIGATAMASNQHTLSRKDWDALLDICRSSADACLTGPDGAYLRSDAEALYQSSRNYDLQANRWLMAAQLSLVTTTALFIIDLNPGEGPDNIPYPAQIRVGSAGSGAGVEMRVAF